MTKRQGAGLRGLTRQGHDLGEGLGREGGRSAGARLIGEDRLDEAEQLGVGGAFGLGGFQAVGSLGPTLAPGTDRLPMEVELMSDLMIGLAISRKADNLEATEHLLGGVLAASQLIEERPLVWCELDGNRARAGHRVASFHAVGSRAVRSSEPQYIPSSLWRWTSAAMY